MITLKRLQYFAKVVEMRSITKAAEQLHIAQPALGVHIRVLENALGVSLLARHSRGVEPTAAGLLLLERADKVFELLSRTKDDVLQVATSNPVSFRLGLTTSIMQLIASDLLLNVQERYPEVMLQLYENPSFLLVDALIRKEVDEVLAYCVEASPELSLTPVMQEQMLFVTRADRAAGRDAVWMEEVLSHDLVQGNERDVARKLVSELALQRGFIPKIKYETHSIAGQRDLVLRGAAASVMPLGAIARELERGDVVARAIADPTMFMTLFVVRRQGADEVTRRHFAVADQIMADCVTMLSTRLGGLARAL